MQKIKVGQLLKTYNQYSQQQIDEEFKGACFNNDAGLVKFLVSHPKLKIKANIHEFGNMGFLELCKFGNQELIEWLIEQSEHTGADIKYKSDMLNAAVRWLCYYDHLEPLKYVLHIAGKREDMPLSHSSVVEGFFDACDAGALDVVQYLLSIAPLNIPIDITSSNNNAFKKAAMKNQATVVKYFIYELKLELTEDIVRFLGEYNRQNPWILAEFKLRDDIQTEKKTLERHLGVEALAVVDNKSSHRI